MDLVEPDGSMCPRRGYRPAAARLRCVQGDRDYVVTLRLAGGPPSKWWAFCDDDLPINVHDGGTPVVVELTWGDGSTTRAFIGPRLVKMAADAEAAGKAPPPTRRLISGPGRPPPALTQER